MIVPGGPRRIPDQELAAGMRAATGADRNWAAYCRVIAPQGPPGPIRQLGEKLISLCQVSRKPGEMQSGRMDAARVFAFESHQRSSGRPYRVFQAKGRRPALGSRGNARLSPLAPVFANRAREYLVKPRTIDSEWHEKCETLCVPSCRKMARRGAACFPAMIHVWR